MSPLNKESDQVRSMFASIAHRYDLLNHLLSLSIDRRWRRTAVRTLLPLLPQQPRVLFVCHNVLPHESNRFAPTLTRLALARLAEDVEGVDVQGPPAAPDRGGVISFTLDGVHAHDVATILDEHGVAVRAGHHCAKPLMRRLGVAATARVSFGVYSNEADLDPLVAGLRSARQIFG